MQLTLSCLIDHDTYKTHSGNVPRQIILERNGLGYWDRHMSILSSVGKVKNNYAEISLLVEIDEDMAKKLYRGMLLDHFGRLLNKEPLTAKEKSYTIYLYVKIQSLMEQTYRDLYEIFQHQLKPSPQDFDTP
jgi:hypothetical protein